MLKHALVFFAVAIVTAVVGFGGVAARAAGIAQILCFAFLIVAIVTLVMEMVDRASAI